MKVSEIPAGLTDFTGKVVLVTGASGGIGKSIATAFAAAGAKTAVHYNTNKDAAEELCFALKDMPAEADCFNADLTCTDDVDVLFDAVVGRFGHLDILINNAGKYPLSPLEQAGEDHWLEVMNSNLLAAHLCTSRAVPVMRKKGSGAIINISSIEAESPAAGHSIYTAAKGGINAYTRAAALELGPDGIRVNAVSPGLIDRPSLRDDWPEGVEAYKKSAPLGRIGRPEDISRVCLFLASPWADWITGINIRVDGGVGLKTPY